MRRTKNENWLWPVTVVFDSLFSFDTHFRSRFFALIALFYCDLGTEEQTETWDKEGERTHYERVRTWRLFVEFGGHFPLGSC